MATDKIDDAIFSIILQIRKNNNRADVNSIHKHIIKIVDFEDVTKEYLDERIHTLITDGKIINKINRNADSYYVNEKDIESILPNDSNTPFISEKSFCTPVISIPDSISETPSIGNNQTSQISKKEIHSNTDELRAEMIALKSFVVDQIYLLILINSIDTYLPILTDIINDSIKNGVFPDELKLAEVIPLFKKDDPFDKSNYRPVSFLSHMSKVFERIIYN